MWFDENVIAVLGAYMFIIGSLIIVLGDKKPDI
jgi:hypothetical protein